jgi:hypothetical protein
VVFNEVARYAIGGALHRRLLTSDAQPAATEDGHELDAIASARRPDRDKRDDSADAATVLETAQRAVAPTEQRNRIEGDLESTIPAGEVVSGTEIDIREVRCDVCAANEEELAVERLVVAGAASKECSDVSEKPHDSNDVLLTLLT